MDRVARVSVADDNAMELREMLVAYLNATELEVVDGKAIIFTSKMANTLNFLGIDTPTGKKWNSRFLGRCLKQSASKLGLEPYRTEQAKGFLWNSREEL
jgi:hypothetical protein